uniref:SnoaL-like domain-containing protein n=1 Tax=Mucochytrium quahogii TaxID=96639 RepID=A0A7S2S4G1_9STRA|mmetsp:Transcript_4489/g.6716  ORF Transcript_4489/g.6716 Transcript_4489/m.6716 type:complete len:165 (+) Transcript_4489:55-549(+)
MGAKQTKISEEFEQYRTLFKARDLNNIVKKFHRDAVVHFFNIQDRKPVVFKGRERIREFFHTFLQTFPEFEYSVSDSKINLLKHVEEENKDEDEEKDEEADQVEKIKIQSCLFDDDENVAVFVYKFPEKGYRFVEETFIAHDKQWHFLSITMDSATDFAGLAIM